MFVYMAFCSPCTGEREFDFSLAICFGDRYWYTIVLEILDLKAFRFEKLF